MSIYQYTLWIDDQLDDSATPERHTPPRWIGVKSSAEAIATVKKLGRPNRMSLDFDLGIGADGKNDTVESFLKWLADTYPNDPPEYEIHSRNVVGVAWIDSFMKSWKRSLE